MIIAICHVQLSFPREITLLARVFYRHVNYRLRERERVREQVNYVRIETRHYASLAHTPRRRVALRFLFSPLARPKNKWSENRVNLSRATMILSRFHNKFTVMETNEVERSPLHRVAPLYRDISTQPFFLRNPRALTIFTFSVSSVSKGLSRNVWRRIIISYRVYTV